MKYSIYNKLKKGNHFVSKKFRAYTFSAKNKKEAKRKAEKENKKFNKITKGWKTETVQIKKLKGR